MAKANSKNNLRPPLQRRSADTLERVFRATEALLEEKPFDLITVADITAKSESSVGAFYARFPDKEALLNALDERYAIEGLERLENTLTEMQRNGSSYRIAREIIEGLWDFHAAKPGLIRSLVLRARTHPDPAYQARGDRLTESLFGAVASMLEPHGYEPRAIHFALLTTLTTVRELTLFPEGPSAGVRINRKEAIDELTRSFVAYLDATRIKNEPGDQ